MNNKKITERLEQSTVLWRNRLCSEENGCALKKMAVLCIWTFEEQQIHGKVRATRRHDSSLRYERNLNRCDEPTIWIQEGVPAKQEDTPAKYEELG
jgi:hypothetical protein